MLFRRFKSLTSSKYRAARAKLAKNLKLWRDKGDASVPEGIINSRFLTIGEKGSAKLLNKMSLGSKGGNTMFIYGEA